MDIYQLNAALDAKIGTAISNSLRAHAQTVPIGAHTVNSTLTAAVTLAPPANARKVIIQAFGANVRYTLDGTVPTATTGFRITLDRDPVEIHLGTGAVLNVIQEAVGGIIQYQWSNVV